MVNKDLKKNSKIRTVNMMIQSALIIILIVLVANMMVEIKNLQGTSSLTTLCVAPLTSPA